MKKYVLKKALQLVVVLFLISLFSFVVIYLAPGDVSTSYIAPNMTEMEKELIREKLGVNRSLPEQYISWASEAIRGNFGVSYMSKTEVLPQLMKKLPATLLLMGVSMMLSIVLAIILGLWAGLKRNTVVDFIISGLSYVGMSIPSFWLGMLLIVVFSGILKVLPSAGMHTVGMESFGDTVKHMIMPCITLCMTDLAVYIRYIRNNTIRELNEEYVLTSKAIGNSGAQLLFRDVLKNTILPIITLVGMNLANIVCGSFIVETVFGWPGIGTYAMSAIIARDYPVIMAYVMLSGTILVVGNFVADLLYAVADPRIKRQVN